MESNFETCLSMLARIRGLTPSPDIDVIDDANKVTVIDLKSSDLVAVKYYLYYLIANSIKKEFPPGLEKCQHTSRVLIFDGIHLFNESEFTNQFVNNIQLKQIQLFRPVDDSMMMMYLYEYLQVSMSTNSSLQLIVIIVNPISLYTDLLDKLNRHLFSLSISVRFLLLSDRLSKRQMEFYLQKSICQIINCMFDQLEPTANKIVKLKITKCNKGAKSSINKSIEIS